MLKNSSNHNTQELIYWIEAQVKFAFNKPKNKITNFNIKSTNSTSTLMNEYIDLRDKKFVEHVVENSDKKNAHLVIRQSERFYCKGISIFNDGKWINRSCYEKHPFICQL